jgi:hypothetical protein
MKRASRGGPLDVFRIAHRRLSAVEMKNVKDGTPDGRDFRVPLRRPVLVPSNERGMGAWHPTLFAANNVACLRTLSIAIWLLRVSGRRICRRRRG